MVLKSTDTMFPSIHHLFDLITDANPSSGLSNPKNVIFFGAGASYGSEVDNGITPPLGDTLFYKLKSRFAQSWGLLPDEISSKFHGGFENGADFLFDHNIYAKHNLNLIQLLKDISLYFSEFSPSEESLYYRLAKKLTEKWDGIFVTLNYDVLLQRALELNSLQFKHCGIRGGGSQKAIELICLHGMLYSRTEGYITRSGSEFRYRYWWKDRWAHTIF